MPAHRNILALQSGYFQKIFKSKMEEEQTKVIKLNVPKGEGEFYKLFIHAFYDSEILTEISAYKLMQVLEIADKYCCDEMIKVIIKDILPKIKITDIKECRNIAMYIEKKTLEVANKAEELLLYFQCLNVKSH